jgi:hypothetical protein
MKRREFVAGLLVAATLGYARAQQPALGGPLSQRMSQELALFDPGPETVMRLHARFRTN